MCQALVGLPAVNVLGVDDGHGEALVVHIESRSSAPPCPSCGGSVWVKDRPAAELGDLPCFERSARLVWHKHRWRCPGADCPVRSWTGEDPRIAPARGAMTDRAGGWVCEQVGRLGRTVAEVARELGCDWHTVNDAVIAYGAALVEDPGRVGEVEALGLDETLFCRQGRWRTQAWCTSIVDVSPGHSQLLDVIPGRRATGPSRWLETRPEAQAPGDPLRRAGPVGALPQTFDDTLAHSVQVADPFHLVKLANSKLDECRRRVQNETIGHRGRKDDPLYRARRRLTKAHERLDERGDTKLRGLFEAGDPRRKVRTAWHAKEVVRSVYDITDPELADEIVAQLGVDLQDQSCPPEVRSLGRTIVRWRDQIVAWHRPFVSNGLGVSFRRGR